jgi:hypothetical protein
VEGDERKKTIGGESPSFFGVSETIAYGFHYYKYFYPQLRLQISTFAIYMGTNKNIVNIG